MKKRNLKDFWKDNFQPALYSKCSKIPLIPVAILVIVIGTFLWYKIIRYISLL